jgi:hypothetical protein
LHIESQTVRVKHLGHSLHAVNTLIVKLRISDLWIVACHNSLAMVNYWQDIGTTYSISQVGLENPLGLPRGLNDTIAAG